jgi:hypothetical protein
VAEASRQRVDLLNQVQSDALVHHALTEWVIAGAHLWSPCLPGSDLEWSMDCSRKPDDSSPPVPMSRPPNWQLRLSAGFPFSRPHLPQNQFSIFTGCSHWRRRLASWTDLPYP